MDPSSDPPLGGFHHHRQGQRMGPSQATGSTSSPPASHSQGPASPSGSTAASSNPFVRSHTDSDVLVAIKCPSLDKDSAVVKVRPTDTVLALKQTIQSTWPGAPRAEGMRCIRSGRILSDNEVFSQLIETLEEGEPLSLHLVIRPDAWSDPQNRPTPSRRSSYLRQQQQQHQQHQHEHSLPRSALATQITPQGVIDDLIPPRHSDTSTQGPSSYVPTFEPYFSDPGLTTAPSPSNAPATDDEPFTSSGNTSNSMFGSGAAHDGLDAYAVLMETLRVTAPENWPLAIEALKEAHDEYVLIYERIYNQAYAAQKGGESATSSQETFSQSDLLTSVETTLLGWDPLQLPSEDNSTTAATSTASPSSGNDTQHLYQQVTHRGLPYLLRISTTPLAIQRSEAMSQLLQRMSALKTVIDKLEYVAMLGRIAQAQHPTLFGTRGNVSGTTAPTHGTAATARTMALEQGGIVATVSRIVRSTADVFRSVTFSDASAVILPMLFVGFKVGVLLSVMLRGADTMKKYFVLGMASVYVVFESYRIVQRRMRARQRMAPRVPTPAPPPVQQGDGNAGGAAAGAAPADGNGTPAPAPMGANVPTAPSHEAEAERQATEDPLRPLPPPQAQLRITSRSFTYDWCIDHMAFVGLDVEDAELGLLPSASTQPNRDSSIYSFLCSSWILPILLFFFTMSPAVEQRRKRAIEERERVIRKWTRLEHERRERVQQMQEEQKQTQSEPIASLSSGDVELQQKRSDYADRILRQRRTTEAVDVDDEDELMARQVAREMADEDQMEDMNVF